MDAVFGAVLKIFISWQSILLGALWLSIMVTIIAFVHELGHYIVAKWCSVKIEAFAIGMGKELFGFTAKSGTRWKLCMFPIGGYVQMFGQSDIPKKDDIQYQSEDEKKQSFANKTPSQKILIALAGPFANIILSFCVLISLLFIYGKNKTIPIISHVQEFSPASKAKIHIGDVITSINNIEINDFMQVRKEISLNGCNEVNLGILRNGKHISVSIKPEKMEIMDNMGGKVKQCLLGISSNKIETINYSFTESVIQAGIDTKSITSDTIRGVLHLISGKRSLKELSGPLKIGKLSHDASKYGIDKFLFLLVVISIGVGVMNLVPIPVLDGGHIFMSIIALIIGQEVPAKIQYIIYQIGFVAIIALMFTGFINDFRYLIKL